MVLGSIEIVQGKAIMERGSWSTTQPQSRMGQLTGSLPSRVCPSLPWAPNSGPGGRLVLHPPPEVPGCGPQEVRLLLTPVLLSPPLSSLPNLPTPQVYQFSQLCCLCYLQQLLPTHVIGLSLQLYWV